MYAQTNPCFDDRLQSGLSASNEKDYNQAIKRWQAALDNCEPNSEQRQKLNDYISQAKNALNNNTSTPSTTTHYSFEPEMVFVKGSTFQMGSNEGGKNEKPVHSVTLSDYYIGKFEVTQKQWREVRGIDPPNLNFTGCDDCPVESVSWEEVQTYLQQLSTKTGKKYLLPTEAEWEFAAIGGNSSNNYTYSGSNNIDDVAWYKTNSDSKTHTVGGKQANKLGIYDMTGNVWEWCSDWYDENYYTNSPPQNPKGASSGTYRTFRGGSWSSSSSVCRVACRGRYGPFNRYSSLGFRVCACFVGP